MLSRAELKQKAKSQLHKKLYWHFVINFVIVAIISGIVAAISRSDIWSIVGAIIAIFILIPLEFGIFFAAFRTTKGRFHICSFLYYFTNGGKKYFKIIGLYILIGIIVSIGTVFFIVPGIILALMFSQAVFLMCEWDCTIMQALKHSNELMKGHKWEMFVLYLSFILWYLLIIITCGIASFFVGPYIITTFANYYQALQLDYTHRSYTKN